MEQQEQIEIGPSGSGLSNLHVQRCGTTHYEWVDLERALANNDVGLTATIERDIVRRRRDRDQAPERRVLDYAAVTGLTLIWRASAQARPLAHRTRSDANPSRGRRAGTPAPPALRREGSESRGASGHFSEREEESNEEDVEMGGHGGLRNVHFR